MRTLRRHFRIYGHVCLVACVSAVLLSGCSYTKSQEQLGSQRVAQLDSAAGLSNTDFATSKALEEFDSTPQSKYTLGPGDQVSVTIWAHPELSGRHVIGPDGDVQIPFVGSIKFADLTADEAGYTVVRVLSDYYSQPVATVTIDAYSGNSVTVLGHVANPGVIHFTDAPTLLEALATAGTRNANNESSGVLSRCAIFRGNDRAMWIDLRPVLRGEDPGLNLRLRRNDLVYVPDSDELVYVMGQVNKPGAYPLTPNMSFLSALALAGGPNDNAQPGEIVLARPSANIEQTINLNKLIKSNGEVNYALKAGDIVYVPKSGLAKVGYVLQQFSPMTQLVLFGAAIH
jgi:polysaccharide biosynthesis/export protein